MMRIAAVFGAAALSAACVSAEYEEDSAEAAEAREALIAARQGEEVDRICFVRNLDNWREFDRNSVLVREGLNDWYRIELSEGCNTDNAFSAIAVTSGPGSTCLRRSDRVTAVDVPLGGTCRVRRMFEWDEDAEVEVASADG